MFLFMDESHKQKLSETFGLLLHGLSLAWLHICILSIVSVPIFIVLQCKMHMALKPSRRPYELLVCLMKNVSWCFAGLRFPCSSASPMR